MVGTATSNWTYQHPLLLALRSSPRTTCHVLSLDTCNICVFSRCSLRLSCVRYFPATRTFRPPNQMQPPHFESRLLNHNAYNWYTVHIESRLRASASLAAFSASFSGFLAAFSASRAAARAIAALIASMFAKRSFGSI